MLIHRAAREIGELCRTHRCTLMAATATFLRLVLASLRTGRFQDDALAVAAEKLPAALIDEFRAKFGISALEGYGCTELSPVISVNVPDVTVNTLTQVGTKVGTVGQPLPGIAVRIVDADQPDPSSLCQ